MKARRRRARGLSGRSSAEAVEAALAQRGRRVNQNAPTSAWEIRAFLAAGTRRVSQSPAEGAAAPQRPRGRFGGRWSYGFHPCRIGAERRGPQVAEVVTGRRRQRLRDAPRVESSLLLGVV